MAESNKSWCPSTIAWGGGLSPILCWTGPGFYMTGFLQLSGTQIVHHGFIPPVPFSHWVAALTESTTHNFLKLANLNILVSPANVYIFSVMTFPAFLPNLGASLKRSG